MEGARWNSERQTITTSRPQEMYTPMPVIHFLPEVNYKSDTKVKNYSTPVYKTSERKGNEVN